MAWKMHNLLVTELQRVSPMFRHTEDGAVRVDEPKLRSWKVVQGSIPIGQPDAGPVFLTEEFIVAWVAGPLAQTIRVKYRWTLGTPNGQILALPYDEAHAIHPPGPRSAYRRRATLHDNKRLEALIELLGQY